MRSRRPTVRFSKTHFSEEEHQLLSTIRECRVQVERLSEEFIKNAIASNNFASEKKKPKKIKSKRHRKNSEHRKRQKKRKYAESESEEESSSPDEFSDEDYVASPTLNFSERRGLRSDGIIDEENQFEPTTSKELFSCKNCAFVTNTEQHLLYHASRHKNICSYCQRQFPSNAECEAHLVQDHTPVVENLITYKCKKCKNYFTVESEYKNHLVSHLDIPSESDKFPCCFCSALFTKHTGVISHIRRVHVDYKCTFCDISAPKFDFLERHCQSSHSHWGRPFECEYCDFKFAVFGSLQLHRSEYHAIEWEEGEYKCRFCHVVLGSKESAVQHFANHIQVPLFKCWLCEFCSNVKEEMREHSKEEHSKPEIFAKEVQSSELMEMVKELIKTTFNQQTIETKPPRAKPTAVETREAIAAICSTESFEAFDCTFEESNAILEENKIHVDIDQATADANHIAKQDDTTVNELTDNTVDKNDVAVDDAQSIIGEVIGTLFSVKSCMSSSVKASENKLPKKPQKGNKRRGRKRKKPKLDETQNNVKQAEENGNIDSVDPFDAETDVEEEGEQNPKAIMSIDPMTNRLCVNGLPVFDKFENEIYVYVE